MTKDTSLNHRIVLNSRPDGAPTPQDFRMETENAPVPGDGQVLLRTLFLSLDPYMRGRMSDGPSYAAPVALNATMVGGTVSRVERSNHPKFKPGQIVLSNAGWQTYAVSDGSDLLPVETADHPSHALSLLGMPGFTAWHGLLKIGAPRPGETVVVAAASGPVGSIVGQIAKIKGARVVGIAGGAEKCRYVIDELGFDACLDRRDAGLAQSLSTACPDGIDVYFENVGGDVFDAVLPLLNVGARMPLCGLVSQYNDRGAKSGVNRLPGFMMTLLAKRIRVQGFIIGDHYADEHAAFVGEMKQWVADGKVKLREDIVDGLENAPEAFIGLLQGKNFGKLVVKVSQ